LKTNLKFVLKVILFPINYNCNFLVDENTCVKHDDSIIADISNVPESHIDKDCNDSSCSDGHENDTDVSENDTNEDENSSSVVDENCSNADDKNSSNDDDKESYCSDDLNNVANNDDLNVVVGEDKSDGEQCYYSLPPQPTDDETQPLLSDNSEPTCDSQVSDYQSCGDDIDWGE
jgi:hypothetical protein